MVLNLGLKIGPQVWLVQASYLTKATNYTLLTLVHFPDRTNYL